jgi:hypothetical protein
MPPIFAADAQSLGRSISVGEVDTYFDNPIVFILGGHQAFFSVQDLIGACRIQPTGGLYRHGGGTFVASSVSPGCY